MMHRYPERWTEEDFRNLPPEDNRYEWKLGLINTQSDENKFRKKLGQELGAFANSFGGSLFVGVSDDKEIVGVSLIWKGNQTTKEWLENVIPTLFELRLQNFRVTELDLSPESKSKINGKVVLVIDVQDSELSPHQCANDKKYYYRVSAKSEPAPHHYLAFLWSRTNSNMPQVVNWWFRNFLDRMIELLGNAQSSFNTRNFALKAEMVQPQIFTWMFHVEFIDVQLWDNLVKGSVGEYFLNTFESTNAELKSLKVTIDSYLESFDRLVKAIRGSNVFKQILLERYMKLIERENIPREQFADWPFQKLAQTFLGQIGSPISNYPEQSEEQLVVFTAYSFLELRLEYPSELGSHSYNVASIANEIGGSVPELDANVAQNLATTRKLYGELAESLLVRWQQLKLERMELSRRYTATFGVE